MRKAAKIAFVEIQTQIPELKIVDTIRLVVWGKEAFTTHKEVFDQVFD